MEEERELTALQEESDEELDMLSDSDVEDEAADPPEESLIPSLHLTTTASRASSVPPRRLSTSADVPHDKPELGERETITEDVATGGEGHADETMEEDREEVEDTPPKREVIPSRPVEGPILGPRKTKVVVRDAAWSTWWAVLFWVSCHLFKACRW